MELYSFKKDADGGFSRKTREVFIKVTISKTGKSLIMSGSGDNKHHLIEDCAILMNKVAGEICGHGS